MRSIIGQITTNNSFILFRGRVFGCFNWLWNSSGMYTSNSLLFQLWIKICVYNLQVISPYNILNSSESGVCVTSPAIGLTAWQALLIEGITTGVLMLVVCAVWDPRSGNGDCGPLKFLVIIFLTSVVVVSTCV